MSVGRLTMRGFAFQGRAFAGWALANGGILPSIQNATTRLALIGASRQRQVIAGTSGERVAAYGTSRKRLTIEGTST